VRVGQKDVTVGAIPAGEAKLRRGAAVTPGQMAESTQETQFGKVPDVFAEQPAHDVEPIENTRGREQERRAHDAKDVGAVVCAAV